MNVLRKLLPAFFFFLIAYSASGTHNRGGEIVYKRIAPYTATIGGFVKQVYTYSITLIKYTDHGPGQVADRCQHTLYFGDGDSAIASRVNGPSNCGCPGACGEIIVNDPDHVVKLNIYSTTHTYPGSGNYLIRTFDPNRNDGVINMLNSVNVPFYLESYLVINAFTTGNNDASPVIMRMATDRAILNQCFLYNGGSYDSDNDSLSYEVTTSRGVGGNTVPGYFYPDGNYAINATTGMLTWCSPTQQGEYALAYLVKQWRRRSCSESYQLAGYVLRDMQVIVNAWPATPTPTVSGPYVNCVRAGATLTHTFSISTGTSGALQLSIYGSSQDPSKGSTATLSKTLVASGQPAVLTWQTSDLNVKKDLHHIVVACTQTTPVTRTVYAELDVLVTAPSPTVYNITVDTGTVKLDWNKLPSNYNVIAYNVYRKFGNSSFNFPSCTPGNPPTSGYTKIGTVSGSTSSLTDFGVWAETDGTPANYIVTAVLDNCAESVADSAVTRTLVNAVEDILSEGSIKIFPSPFSTKLVIEAMGEGILNDCQVSVFTVDGKLVSAFRNREGHSLIINTDMFEKGLYLVEIKGASGTFQQKVIKD